MTLIVEWRGQDVDVDPEEFSTREIGLIKERTGLAYPELILGVISGEGDAIRALFWLVDQRADPGLRFSDYDGPPVKMWKALLPRFTELVGELGKATTDAKAQLGEGGLATSLNGSATPQLSSTP